MNHFSMLTSGEGGGFKLDVRPSLRAVKRQFSPAESLTESQRHGDVRAETAR